MMQAHQRFFNNDNAKTENLLYMLSVDPYDQTLPTKIAFSMLKTKRY